MALTFKRFIHHATAAANTVFGTARQPDYKTLNRYMLAINQSQTQENTLRETARYLKKVLNHQALAFILQNRNPVEAWINPCIYQRLLKSIIKRDFGASPPLRFHALGEPLAMDQKSAAFRNREPVTYSVIKTNGPVQMYIFPKRPIRRHQAEALKIIVKTLDIALNNHLCIKQLKDNVAIDPLTGCYNRREFNRLAGHHIAGAKRHAGDFSLIMLDVDHFKQVNDTHGHQAGDSVLKAIAAAVSEAIRDGDYLARYGGEEFVVLLPNTGMPRAIELAKRLRRVIEALRIPLPNRQKISKTASFGVASLHAHDDLDSLVKAADTRLYQAKSAGRNQVMPNLYAISTKAPLRAVSPGK